MGSRAHYLAVLGLPPEASNEDATSAYKDLIRVWHPDRFQNDDRLRRKAEDETKKLNDAIARVKKLPRESTKSSSEAKQRQRSNNRPQQRHQGRNEQEDYFAAAYGPKTFSRPTFEISPLDVKPRLSSSISRCLLGALVVATAISAILSPPETPLKSGGMITLVFVGTEMTLWNAALIFFRRQRIRVDKLGIYVQGIGRLLWPDVQRVWVSRLARTSFLAINFSEEYLQRQNYLLRMLYRLRTKLGRAHTILSFSGLNSEAMQVVDAINLRHHTGYISIPNTRVTPSPSLFWCNFISVLCPAMVVVRCLSQEVLEATDYLPYAAIFLACRLYAIAVATVFAKPAVVK